MSVDFNEVKYLLEDEVVGGVVKANIDPKALWINEAMRNLPTFYKELDIHPEVVGDGMVMIEVPSSYFVYSYHMNVMRKVPKMSIVDEPEKMLKVIAGNLKFLMEMNGTTQEDLAYYIGVHPNSIWRYVNAKSCPTMSVCIKIAKYFNTDVGFFERGF